jgi:uncharacterized membrane protein YphA (DoxX/SURF4 family)
LRIAVAVSTIAQGICTLTPSSGGVVSTDLVLGLFLIVAGTVFLIGFLTPIVGFILTLAYLTQSVTLFISNDSGKRAAALTALYLSLMCLALALIGPGAFSADARLFGRLEIIIPKRRGPPR